MKRELITAFVMAGLVAVVLAATFLAGYQAGQAGPAHYGGLIWDGKGATLAAPGRQAC